MVFENRLQRYCKCTEKPKFQKHKNPSTLFSASPTPYYIYTHSPTRPPPPRETERAFTTRRDGGNFLKR